MFRVDIYVNLCVQNDVIVMVKYRNLCKFCDIICYNALAISRKAI